MENRDNQQATRFVVVGLGRLGLEFLKRVSRDYLVTCISMDEDAEAKLMGIDRDDVELLKGDATSRLMLEKAGVEGAEAVIITTTQEDVSLEIARLLKNYFTVKRVISAAVTERAANKLKALGVEIEDLHVLGALELRNTVESKTKTPHSIGIGKEEILEVELHPNSRLANKPLGFLKPLNWRIGIIYRDGNIIIPKSETVLKPKDKVVILGDPQVLKSVAEMMIFNFQKFPLEYGETFVVYLGGYESARQVREINYVHDTFPHKNSTFVYSSAAAIREQRGGYAELNVGNSIAMKSDRDPLNAMAEAFGAAAGNQGLVIIAQSTLNSVVAGYTWYGRMRFIKSLLNIARCPVLVMRGTFPYEDFAVPCISGIDVAPVMETALDIRAELSAGVAALMVKPSEYISRPEEAEAYEVMKKTMATMGMLYKTRVFAKEFEGNPVQALQGMLKPYNLFITALEPQRKSSWLDYYFSPDVIWHLVRRAPISTLIIPEEV